ncbi:MAG: hypothetical protein U5L02_19600 [Rheinheimera sp.]|nr:hypothetical protein [Rheinheimera sp.]
MNGWIDSWALLNTVLIMFALGLAWRPGDTRQQPAVLLRATLGYNLLIPALGLLVLASQTSWFQRDTVLALGLCIAAGGGTSVGAFVQKTGAAPALTATLIMLLQGLSLIVIAGLAFFGVVQFDGFAFGVPAFGALSLADFAGFLLLITVAPFLAGIAVNWYWPQRSLRWQPRLERAGSALVLCLVAALMLQYGPDVLSGPAEPLWAAATLVLLLVVPPLLFERQAVIRKTLVLVSLVRNLTLTLALLALMPQASALLPTVLAFGLAMYLMCGVLLWRWRALR